MAKKKVLFDHRWALGDTLLFQGMVRDFRKQYGDRYEIHVSTHYRDLWDGNEDADGVHRSPPKGLGARPIPVRWWQGKTAGAMHKGEPLHILGWYHECVSRLLGVPFSPHKPHGKYVFLPKEKAPFVTGDYWVLVAGGKIDASTKIWPKEKWQELVHVLNTFGISTVQIGSNNSNSLHFPLEGTINLVGQVESARDFLRVIRDAKGVVCGVTGAMHAAAIMQKPCVVIAGGREEPAFEAYDHKLSGFGPTCEPIKIPHRFLHTMGKLPCCMEKGCWKFSVTKLHEKDRFHPERMCVLPVLSGEKQYAAKCMTMIEPKDVGMAVLSYYADETIPTHNVEPAVSHIPVADAQQQAKTTRLSSRLFVKQPRLQSPPRTATVDDRRYTVFVLCYGNYPQLATKCIGSILKSVDRSRIDLRVTLNAASEETKQAVLAFQPDVVYENKENTGKYKLMRAMFRDPDHPVTTEYVVWFDDDTWVVDLKWLDKLDKVISDNQGAGYRAFGCSLFHDLKESPTTDAKAVNWFKNASWWRRRDLRLRGSKDYAPNGSCIDFPVGWFWAARYDALMAADIPDSRLNHNGGDITIGAQFHQAGFKIYDFNPKKALIACPTRQNGGRRGYSESFPWLK